MQILYGIQDSHRIRTKVWKKYCILYVVILGDAYKGYQNALKTLILKTLSQ